MSEEIEMNDFQREMAKILADVEAHKPDTSDWVRIKQYFFDLKEVCSVKLHYFSPDNGQTTVALLLRNGTTIEFDHIAARNIWEAFTGEKLIKKPSQDKSQP